MITIYYSNKLECLEKILIELIFSKKLDNPLYPEIILSENTAMIERLYIKISEYFGISANIKFFSSFDFIWSILKKSLWGIFPKETLSHSVISWVLMEILSNINNEDITCNFSIIKEYLDNDINKDKCLQFSEKIKNLFIQYFIYHQDWLFQWKNENMVEELDIYTQSWQSELWRLFLKTINNHKNKKSFVYFQNRTSEYISNFLKKNILNLKNKLPERIFIYGISYFPPILLEILQSLGKYIDIYIFCINPCRFFLKYNINYNNIISIIQKRSQLFHCFSEMKSCDIFNRNFFLPNQDKVYNNIGNFLLSSWGKKFQETFYSLLQLDVIYEKNIFIENINSVSLLHILQNDILNNYSRNFYSVNDIPSSIQKNVHLNIKRNLLSSDDHSLSVHICHNIQREIEVLHDNLLAMMSDDPLLLPHEIIVMAPDINNYISTIHSVFGSASIHDRHLPFTIFYDAINNINVIMSSFLKLLNLSCIKFSVEDILELLSVPALALRFDIDKDQVKLLTTWILESGICWGLDDDIFSDYKISSDNNNVQYTWKFGLTRMLLNYAINSSNSFWNNIFPYTVGDSISLMDLVGQLSFFLMKLKYWKDRFLKSYVLEEWLPLAEKIINDFYIINYDTETESTLVELKFFWKEIINSGIKANYLEPISINILYNKLYNKLLKKKKKKHRFFSGNIVFCNLDSVKSIPFKVVYLLGINVNFYPGNNKVPLNFDLMQYEARCDDCHASCSDRYLFLETLLSARERLYISFVGYSQHDYTKFFSSILIEELFEYIIHNFFYVEMSTKKILSISIEWIYHNLCYWHTHVPFSLKNFIFRNKHQSFFKEWLPNPYDNTDVSYEKFLYSLPEVSISVIRFSSLCNFYFHPIRAWFQNRLKIYIPKVLEFPTDEPFSVAKSIKYKMCKDLISSFLNKKENVNIIYKRFLYSGVLPYGNFGNLFWMQQCEIMLKLSRRVNEHYLLMDRHDLQFSLDFHNNFQLTGMLTNVQRNGLVRWKPRVLSIGDGLSLWLEHLVYCATGGKGDSWMFGINSSWHFIPLSCVEAKEYLLFLISGYFYGLSTPLLLLNHSGGCWLRNCFDFKKKSISTDLNCQFEARRKLIIAWEGNQYIRGDSSDPYVRKLIPQLRDKDIESIISSSKKYFLFPMKFNV